MCTVGASPFFIASSKYDITNLGPTMGTVGASPFFIASSKYDIRYPLLLALFLGLQRSSVYLEYKQLG
jgi:uncharacterized protein (DUF779 family)